MFVYLVHGGGGHAQPVHPGASTVVSRNKCLCRGLGKRQMRQLCVAALCVTVRACAHDMTMPTPATFPLQVVPGGAGSRPVDHCHCAQVLPSRTSHMHAPALMRAVVVALRVLKQWRCNHRCNVLGVLKPAPNQNPTRYTPLQGPGRPGTRRRRCVPCCWA
jgi:hypothetical protein